MGNVTYLGGRNGQNPQLEKAKAEALELQNRLTRLKVEKLEGTLVEKKLVAYLTTHALTRLREQVLTLPGQVSARLRAFGLSPENIRAIRTDVGNRVHRFLGELGEGMERAINEPEFLAEYEGEEKSVEGDDHAKVGRELKHDAVNRKRREKRHEKQARAAKAAS